MNSGNGLPSNQINSMIQDETGYIWMGTSNGLIRYDGIRYKVFKHHDDDSTSIPFNILGNLRILERNELWLMTWNKQVGRFNTATFKFKPSAVLPEDPVSMQAPVNLIKDEYGNLFLLLVDKEILVRQKNTDAFVPANEFFPRDKSWQISGFVQQPGTQKYWAAGRGKGFAVFNKAAGKLSTLEQNIENEFFIKSAGPINHVVNLFFDSRNRLWYVSWADGYPRMNCFDFNAGRFLLRDYSLLKELKGIYYEINGIYELRDGTIWIRGSHVLGYFDEKMLKFNLFQSNSPKREDMEFVAIKGFLEDRDGGLWVGTGNNGLFRFNPGESNFTNVEYKSRTTGERSQFSPRSWLNDKDGTLLVGVWQEELMRFDRNFNRLDLGIKGIKKLGKDPPVWDMSYDPDGVTAWFACQPGIYRYNTRERSAQYYNPKILENRTVRQIKPDKKGNLWLGMQRLGVFWWDKEKGKDDFEKGISPVESKINSFVNKILVDSKGMVWVATSENGLVVFDAETRKIRAQFGKIAPDGKRIPENAVSDIIEYDDSLVVFSTPSNVIGYNRLTDHTRIIRSSDFISGLTASLQKDSAGNIWVSTTTGLFRIHPHTKVTVSFNRHDGIGSDHFIESSSSQLPDGTLLFGATDQILAFKPDKIRPGRELPVKITDLINGTESLPLSENGSFPEHITINSDQNMLTIEMSHLSFTGWYAVQYKMEGLDKTWITADKSQRAVYSYIPPGNYRFICRTIDPEFNFSKEQFLFHLYVRPPFWNTWWFYGLAGLSLAALFFWFDNERMKRKEAVIAVRNKIADDLHQEVNTALNNINILSEMANIKADTDPGKSKEFMSQIHKKSRDMILSLDDMLWSIDPANDGMDKSTARMREYIESVKVQYNKPAGFMIAEGVNTLKMDMQVRFHAYALFKEGVSAMAEICRDGFDLHVSAFRNELTYTLVCRGGEYDEQRLNNLMQRRDLGNRLQTIGASIWLDKKPEGFCFKMNVPLISPTNV